MKSKRKKVFLIGVMIVTALFLAALCVSCGLFGADADVVPVTIDNITLLKTATDYTETNEYLFNKDSDNNMALQSGEDFYLQITYNNPKKYAISYVTVTPEGENAQKITAKDFDAKSSKQKTVIRFSIGETNVTNDIHNYTIKKIYYVTGNETRAIKFEDNVAPTFGVVVNPTYKLTLDYENTDRRAGSSKTEDDVIETNNVAFGVEMSSVGVMTKDYTKPESMPEKAGGWKFEGWYTERNGQGICVGSNDKFFFWSNVTLYAHYSRLFSYEIVDLPEPIQHEYTLIMSGEPVVQTKTFYAGAIITGDMTAGKAPYLSLDDTIVDETVQASGYVTAEEYPVIGVANNAFKDVNNITSLTIGRYITEIGYCSFDNCNKLEKVTFSQYSTLKSLGDFAFQNTKLMGITSAFTLPVTVEYIGNFCFRYSGWSNTNNNGINESVLHIYPRYKFIGVAAFFQTGFSKVVFEAGCHFDSQIGYDEGKDIETNSGWKNIRSDLNRIGMNLFGGARNLEEVEFLSDDPDNNAINIIPDRCFDAGQYKNMKLINRLIFAEGVEFIGAEAFNYQERIPYLDLPASVKEIGRSAFYNNISVATLSFREGSQLEILHRRCFGNLASIDRVQIISTDFAKYGDGPFEGCGRLKSIEFPYINDPQYVPQGFNAQENSDEVNTAAHHYYADLMFGTFVNSSYELEEDDGSFIQVNTYALPTRVFCKGNVVNAFRDRLTEGKDTFYRSKANYELYHSGEYNNVVFVHDIDLIKSYENPTAELGEPEEVEVALQEVYDANTDAILGYSVVYWAYPSKVITIPSTFPGLKGTGKIIEIAMYALPTSVAEVIVPSTVTRLEHDAFNGCTKLENVTFENIDTLEYIGDYAFFGTKISEFEGGTSLKVIGENAFMRCTSLQWVDLMNTAITNPFKIGNTNPRLVYLRQYKYAYELNDKDEQAKDHYDVLYDGAFRGCKSLRWVALPIGLKQVPEALFSNCPNLRTVVIPCKGISTANNATDDDTFYYRALPSAIYTSSAMPYMNIYVPSSELTTHQTIFPVSYGVTYNLIKDDYSDIPAK